MMDPITYNIAVIITDTIADGLSRSMSMGLWISMSIPFLEPDHFRPAHSSTLSLPRFK